MNDFDKKLLAQHSYKSYREHFKTLYYVVEFAFKPLLLMVSVYLSTQFIGNALGGTDTNFVFGFIGASSLALFIYFGTDTLIGYNQSQGAFELLIMVAVVFCYGLNIYMDYNSSFYVGKDLTGEEPADTKTAEYSKTYNSQIEAIDRQILDIEKNNFYWCPVHASFGSDNSRKHICNHPRNQRHVNRSDNNDIIAEQKVNDLQAQKQKLQSELNNALSNANEAHTMALNDYTERLGNNRKYTKYTSLVCSTIFFLLSFWSKQYGLKGVSEIVNAKRISKNVSHTQVNVTAKRNKKKKKRKKTKQEEPNVYEEDREELTNEELNEELSALREAEKRANEGK